MAADETPGEETAPCLVTVVDDTTTLHVIDAPGSSDFEEDDVGTEEAAKNFFGVGNCALHGLPRNNEDRVKTLTDSSKVK